MLVATTAIARFVFAVLFSYSAIAKLHDRPAFRDAVAAYSIVPARAVRPVANLTVVAEMAVGVSLMVDLVPRGAYAAAGSLLMLFGAAVTWELLRGRSIDCGCLGAGSGAISWRIPVRNLILAGVAFACAWIAPSVGVQPSSISDVAGFLAAVVGLTGAGLIAQAAAVLPAIKRVSPR